MAPLTGGGDAHAFACEEYDSGEGEGEAFAPDEDVVTAAAAAAAATLHTSLDPPPVPPHPLGIKPLGNKFLHAGADAKTAAGGLAALPDELLMQVLEWLDAEALLALGATCRCLFAFCTFDELWKSQALGIDGWRPSAWHGTWRATLLDERRAARRRRRRQQQQQQQPEEEQKKEEERQGSDEEQPPPMPLVDAGCVFSDVLHRPFVCSWADPAWYARGIPAANAIARLEDLTHEAFAAAWTDRPFVLTANRCVGAWPALRNWSLDALAAQQAATVFRAEAVDWPYALYDQYLRRTADESPLYLFDRGFAEKMGESGSGTDEAYWPPRCFGPDLFAVLGPQRPAHRWLIVGPARSGSTFHKDPNGTSAWNAVVRGAKYWVLFPPGAAVPGVFASADEGEVTSPLSIAEWLLTFHAAARATPGCVEGVCRAGEVLHVPSGWWHLVVNLEPGIALTQNFVPRAHLAAVLRFLRDRPEQVTGWGEDDEDDEEDQDGEGCPQAGRRQAAYDLFVERLAAQHPALLAEALAELAPRAPKRTWDAVVRGDDGDAKRPKTEGFSFGFGDGDEVE